ncbi:MULTISPECIES: 2-hydroxychromene-2-carboxylate isomerase [unclassified Minwuia]|jgi:2-hydroxychromene-2-carboxylate isomerase|uniref:2-hydroxychromene-2-carboxylate isomerase n=1 Tax=unclassified Minwuia TaxID=2618799 RepID=UPI00247A81D5|nr:MULTISPECIES: 2-hydroxychromene-2-carboxylate isomerase [unclassified Minwuia]
MAKEIEFFWDTGSTNTYFALHLIRPLAARHGATIRMRPFNLGHVFRHHKYVLMEEPAAKIANRKRDLERWAARHDLPFRFPDTFPIKTSISLRGSLVAREFGCEDAYLDAIFRRYWEQNDASVATLAGLADVAREIGQDPEDFVRRTEEPAMKQALIDETDNALKRGVFGAPSFIVGTELFWGKDRMEFIADALQAAD